MELKLTTYQLQIKTLYPNPRNLECTTKVLLGRKIKFKGRDSNFELHRVYLGRWVKIEIVIENHVC